MQTIGKLIKSFIPGICILLMHGILVTIFRNKPIIVDNYYQNGLFRFFRKGYDQTLGLLDFPFIYVLLPLLLILLTFDIRSIAKQGKLKILAYLFNYFCFFFFFFYCFWAYNYYATSLSNRMKMDKVEINQAYLTKSLKALAPKLSAQRNTLDTSISFQYTTQQIERLVRPQLSKYLNNYGYYTKSKPRVKPVFDGALMRLRTSGIYISYVFEGHFDPSIYRTQWPFTIAHEMAHGYGVTDEKECNFLAYVACLESPNNYVRYSALIAHWRYLAFALIKEDNDLYQEIREMLSESVIADLDKINKAITKYPELMPKSRDKIYDQYLKSHGISDGIISYDKMIEMIAQWQNDNRNK